MERKSLQEKPAGPLQCAIGAAIAGGFAVPLYWLSRSIAQSFADKPIHSTNPTAVNISVAVRTLVMGGGFLMAGVFAIAAVGLGILALQMLVQGHSQAAVTDDRDRRS